MVKRLTIIKKISVLAIIITLIMYIKALSDNKPLKTELNKNDDLEAVCVTVLMSVY